MSAQRGGTCASGETGDYIAVRGYQYAGAEEVRQSCGYMDYLRFFIGLARILKEHEPLVKLPNGKPHPDTHSRPANILEFPQNAPSGYQIM